MKNKLLLILLILIVLAICLSVFCSKSSYKEVNKTNEQYNNDENKNQSVEESENEYMYITINNNKFEVKLYDNESVMQLINKLKSDKLELSLRDYSGFEKVGNLGFSLPSNNENITTSNGDIVLYNENQIVMFYGSNTWSYTRIGKVLDLDGWKKTLNKTNDIKVIISLD